MVLVGVTKVVENNLKPLHVKKVGIKAYPTKQNVIDSNFSHNNIMYNRFFVNFLLHFYRDYYLPLCMHGYLIVCLPNFICLLFDVVYTCTLLMFIVSFITKKILMLMIMTLYYRTKY